MFEPEAYKALNDGFVKIDGIKYKITKHPRGWCEGCCFYDDVRPCPHLAHKICSTGGVVFSPMNE